MKHLLNQPEAREAHERGDVLGRALIVEFLGHRVQLDTIDAPDRHDRAVHCQHHALHGRHALIRRLQAQHIQLSRLGERHRAVAQAIASGAEINSGAIQLQQVARVADPATGDHCGDVGDTKQLCRLPVGAGVARLTDPHTDGDLGVGHTLQQVLHVGTADHRSAGIELQDQRLRAVVFAASDGVFDGLNGNGIEQAGDLQHVDGGKIGGCASTCRLG